MSTALAAMPRFVILEHDHPVRHWDLMLEAGDVLRTWRLAAPPRTSQAVAAEAIGDHRPLYLDYEGPVSGNRGTVSRWDAGTFAWVAQDERRVVVRMEGTRTRGLAALCADAAGAWSLVVEDKT